MVRKIREYNRPKKTRTRRKVIILGLEGKLNKTEVSYFSSLERELKNIHFIYAKNNTDPISIVNSTISKAKSEEIKLADGDMAISIFDVDNNLNKKNQIKIAKLKANKSKYKVRVITSNPCFEVWYLEHFLYTTKLFQSSKQLKKEMNQYINEYKENGNYFMVLYPNTKKAILNCERLRKHNKKIYPSKDEEYYNPSTNVDEIVKELIS